MGELGNIFKLYIHFFSEGLTGGVETFFFTAGALMYPLTF